MGLLYPFDTHPPSSFDRKSSSPLKTLGLPLLFWGYLAALFTILSFMYLAIRHPLAKLLATSDPLASALSLAVYALFIAIPLVSLAFFGYQKTIHKEGHSLTLTHYLFGLRLWRKTITLKTGEAFTIHHFMDSPNLAHKYEDPRLKGFQNRGYHQIFAECSQGRKHFIDRHSQLREIKRLKAILEKL